MPIDYVTPVGGDQGAVLQIGADIDASFSFTIPVAPSNAQAILTLQRRVQNPDSLRWTTTINGSGLRTYTDTSGDIGAIQEVFAGSILNTGNNTVAVRIESGQGRLEVSDFVIYYRT